MEGFKYDNTLNTSSEYYALVSNWKHYQLAKNILQYEHTKKNYVDNYVVFFGFLQVDSSLACLGYFW